MSGPGSRPPRLPVKTLLYFTSCWCAMVLCSDLTSPHLSLPILSFACVAKLWSRAAHCAHRTVALLLLPATLNQGLLMTSWKKSNVLPQITSLWLLAVNFLPCVRALQINAGGSTPPFFLVSQGSMCAGGGGPLPYLDSKKANKGENHH